MYRAAILYLALVSMVALINQHRLSFALLPVHASLHSLSLLVALAFFHSSSGLVFLPDWLCLSFFICSSLVASHSLSQGWITGRMKDWLYSFSNAFLLSSLMVAILSCLPGWVPPGTGPASLIWPHHIEVGRNLVSMFGTLVAYVAIRMISNILEEVDYESIENRNKDQAKLSESYIFHYSTLNQFVIQLFSFMTSYYIFSVISCVVGPRNGAFTGIDPINIFKVSSDLCWGDLMLIVGVFSMSATLSYNRDLIQRVGDKIALTTKKNKKIRHNDEQIEEERWVLTACN
eukprot:GHVH01002362.1.p1 GENE.GHVH01002362.1~~GHVH01002362.1.p1  ORF type:complete len:289 (-),score=21.72 GHVH01002362.1:7-873(-)